MPGQGLSSLIPQKGNEEHTRGEEKAHPEVLPLVNAHEHVAPPREKRDHHAHESVFQIETEKIKPNPYQPRHEFEEEGIEELMQSIREFGVIQPLIVSSITEETESGTRVSYQLIAGERRLRAAKKLGLAQVPAIIRAVNEGRSKLEMALIENIQREDLNPLEAANAYVRLADEFQLTQREIARKVGKSRETVANAMRLLGLPAHIQSALREKKISESQARTLLGINDREAQENAFRDALEKKTSVHSLRMKRPAAESPSDSETAYWKKRFEETLGMPVAIAKKNGKGKITLSFYSEEEWNALVGKLLGEMKE